MTELWPAAVRTISPGEQVETTVVQRLRNDPDMTALVDGRVYTAIPPNAAFPLVLVGSTTDIPFNRFRHAGSDCTVTVRASSQQMGTWEAHRIAMLTRALNEGQDEIPFGPFRAARWTFESASGFEEELSGMVTYHRPVLIRVRVTIA